MFSVQVVLVLVSPWREPLEARTLAPKYLCKCVLIRHGHNVDPELREIVAENVLRFLQATSLIVPASSLSDRWPENSALHCLP